MQAEIRNSRKDTKFHNDNECPEPAVQESGCQAAGRGTADLKLIFIIIAECYTSKLSVTVY